MDARRESKNVRTAIPRAYARGITRAEPGVFASYGITLRWYFSSSRIHPQADAWGILRQASKIR